MVEKKKTVKIKCSLVAHQERHNGDALGEALEVMGILYCIFVGDFVLHICSTIYNNHDELNSFTLISPYF